jgi:hypothetical protein
MHLSIHHVIPRTVDCILFPPEFVAIKSSLSTWSDSHELLPDNLESNPLAWRLMSFRVIGNSGLLNQRYPLIRHRFLGCLDLAFNPLFRSIDHLLALMLYLGDTTLRLIGQVFSRTNGLVFQLHTFITN